MQIHLPSLIDSAENKDEQKGSCYRNRRWSISISCFWLLWQTQGIRLQNIHSRFSKNVRFSIYVISYGTDIFRFVTGLLVEDFIVVLRCCNITDQFHSGFYAEWVGYLRISRINTLYTASHNNQRISKTNLIFTRTSLATFFSICQNSSQFLSSIRSSHDNLDSLTTGWDIMAHIYEQVVSLITKQPKDRKNRDVELATPWFKDISELFKSQATGKYITPGII